MISHFSFGINRYLLLFSIKNNVNFLGMLFKTVGSTALTDYVNDLILIPDNHSGDHLNAQILEKFPV